MANNFKAGDLVQIGSPDNTWVLCLKTLRGKPTVEEVPHHKLEIYSHPQYKNMFLSLEGKVGLIVYISRNKLDQAIGYRVLIEGREVFCKAIVANKYFNLIGTKESASGRFSAF